MALTGRLEAYTFFTFAEDNEKSPWEPYTVSLGYKPEDSTVTVATSGNPVVLGGGAVAPWTAQGVIDQMVARISGGGGFGWFHSQTFVIVLHSGLRRRFGEHRVHSKELAGVSVRTVTLPFEKLSPATGARTHTGSRSPTAGSAPIARRCSKTT